MTMTEKILSNHIDSDASSSTSSAARSVRPGDNVWTKVDKLMTHDVCGPGTFGIFQKEFGESARVWDPEAVIIIPVSCCFVLFYIFSGLRVSGERERGRGRERERKQKREEGRERGRRRRREIKKRGSLLIVRVFSFETKWGQNGKTTQDHYIFTSDARANRNVDILRDMAKQYGIKHFYDIQDRSDFKANPDYKGEKRKKKKKKSGFFEVFFCRREKL